VSLGPDQLLERLSAQLTAVLAPGGWRESPYPFDLFPGGIGDDQVVQPLEFAIGLRGSAVEPGRQARTGDNRGAVVTTEVRVRFTAGIRADGMLLDYRDAHRRERELVDAVISVHGDPGMSVRWMGIETRAVPLPGMFAGEARFAVLHVYPLGD